MTPADWIEHRRGVDRELLGWIVPVGDGFTVVDLLGRPHPDAPADWVGAEEYLEELGIGYLADRYAMTADDGAERLVRIAELSTAAVTVVADDFGAASAVGSHPERFRLPFPVPAGSLRRVG
jgi:hypothetical protein